MPQTIDPEQLKAEQEKWDREHPKITEHKRPPTYREKELLRLLKNLTRHVRKRNAMGYYSELFCMGCETDRLHPCPLPEVLKYLEAESRRQGDWVDVEAPTP